MSKTKRSGVDRFLAIIERAGNALPHPATLFAILALVVVLISWLADLGGLTATHPATGDPVTPKNLLSAEGLHFILTKMVANFTGFAPLGTVLVALLGIGIAEGSGLIGAVLRAVVLASPKRLLTFVIVLAGVVSNAASEVGYVLLVPLAAVIFLAAGRHPLAGLAAAFAGVSGGYSANVLLGTIDPLLAGLSQEAARIIRPDYLVNPACNYYFMFVSTFVIAGLGTWVTERIVVPRLGEYTGDEKPEVIREASSKERKGMLYAGLTVLAFVGFILSGLIPEQGFLRDPKTFEILHSPFMSGIV
ncbi:MAG TPA: AbgT family transporter, partial [Flavobacteriales bacterium]|nr:AbgT family transporter [Flavobacteriales bacterium]